MKIMIIGYSGAGKSTLAKALGKHYSVPVLYLDKIQFLSGWVDRDNQEATQMIEDFLNNNNSWVIDGNYQNRLFERRGQEADQIIYLNYNRFLCLYQAIKRKNKYKNKSRESITEGCEERIDLSFVYWILYDGRRTKYRKKKEELRKLYPEKFIEFKKPKQLEEYYKDYNLVFES